MNLDLEVINRNIDERKKDLGFSYDKEVADAGGLHRGIFTKIRTGHQKTLRYDSADKLAKVLQCNLDWLLTGNGHKEPVVPAFQVPLFEPDCLIRLVGGESFESISKGCRKIICPVNANGKVFAVFNERNLERYRVGGYIFFSLGFDRATPAALIKVSDTNYNVCGVIYGFDEVYFKSLSPDVPNDKKITVGSEADIIAKVIAYVLNE